MAKRNYKVNEAIEVPYQSAGSLSGLTDVTMQIFDETGSLDGVDFPDVIMAEVGVTGKYVGSFTPDAVGEWTIHVAYNSGTDGQVVKQFSVGNFNLNDIGESTTVIEAAVVAIDAPPMIG